MWGDETDPDQYIVLAVDPGGTTGWCVVGVHPDALSGDPEIRILENVEFWTCGQFEGAENDQSDEIVELVATWPSARLVLEEFILRKPSMGRELLSPVRISAVIDWAVRPRYWVRQQPALAMTTITDDRQKDMGLWVPGKEHARDAIKHAFTFLKRQRERQIQSTMRFRKSAEAARWGK